jgi:hypothetical protein
MHKSAGFFIILWFSIDKYYRYRVFKLKSLQFRERPNIQIRKAYTRFIGKTHVIPQTRHHISTLQEPPDRLFRCPDNRSMSTLMIEMSQKNN